MHDQLTGLLIPDAFRVLVEHELVVARRLGRVDTLLVVDVDHMGQMNDALGVDQGDEILRAVAGLIRRTARESDVVGRLGGDEFAIYALDCQGNALAERIGAAAMSAPIAVPGDDGFELPVGIRIGLLEVEPGETFDALMMRAGPSALKGRGPEA
jgi:diguanylate cyclase (GGDEF)-like protein